MTADPRFSDGQAAEPVPARPEEVDAKAVLLVIPALNEARHIETCLRSLLGDDPALAAGARVVVADGGSTDGTPGIVARLRDEFPGVELLHNPERLQSAGLNKAVRDCAGPQHRYLVRCDAHAAYPPGFVRRCVAAAEQTGAASVVTVMDAVGESCFARAAAWAVDTPLGSGGAAHRGGANSGWVDHGHHAAFRLDWFRRVGGYDPQFSHNEDAEYDRRLAAAGGGIWLAADIRLDYRMRPGPRPLARQYFNYGRGRAATVRKHRIVPRLRQVAPAVNGVLLVGGLVLAPVWSGALAWPALYAAGLAAAGAAGAWKLRSACGLLAAPALAIMHNAWAAGFLTGLVRRA